MLKSPFHFDFDMSSTNFTHAYISLPVQVDTICSAAGCAKNNRVINSTFMFQPSISLTEREMDVYVYTPNSPVETEIVGVGGAYSHMHTGVKDAALIVYADPLTCG